MIDVEAPRPLIREAVTRALAEDLGPLGDLTAALLDPDARAGGVIAARAAGVLAGSACVSETFAQLDPAVVVRFELTDGAPVEPQTVVATIEGPARSVVTGERTALNFLCHLSGVATLTRQFVLAAAPMRVLETRKTLPGLRALEKAAVRAGGGVNHRGSLSDLVLVKDNHLVGLTIPEAVARARHAWPGRGVEVECDRAEQVDEAISAGADLVMLDNFSPEAARDAVATVRSSARPHTLVEVSGGMTLDAVAAYAAGGADLLSTSAITQSVPALDLGLDLDSVETR